MPGWLWVVIVIAALIIIGAIAATALRARRSRELQGRFGPEYDRVAADAPSKRQAEAELRARAERHDELRPAPARPTRSRQVPRSAGRTCRRSSSTIPTVPFRTPTA